MSQLQPGYWLVSGPLAEGPDSYEVVYVDAKGTSFYQIGYDLDTPVTSKDWKFIKHLNLGEI
jgi:hypothetical protein